VGNRHRAGRAAAGCCSWQQTHSALLLLTRGWRWVHGGTGLEAWLCWLQHRRHAGAEREQPPGRPLPALEGGSHDLRPMLTRI
jgi:hypothetical protein